MDLQKNNFKRKILNLALLSILTSASSQVLSGPVFNTSAPLGGEKTPVFNTPIPLNGASTWKPSEGDQFKYENVYSGVDAIITIEDVPAGEEIYSFDIDTTGEINNFQPQIDHHGKSVLFSIAFVQAGTSTPAEDAAYCMTSMDMDNYEFIGYDDLADFTHIDNSVSKLEAYTDAGTGYSAGYIPIEPFNLSGVGLEKTATASVRYASTHKIMFRLGSRNWPASFQKPWWGNNNMVRSMHAISFSGCDEIEVPPIPQGSCRSDLSWKNEGAARFIHWGVHHKMVHEDDHQIFDSSILPDSLTNPPTEGTEVTINLGSWEERTPNVAEGWQPGEQINVIFVDTNDNVIWRSAFTDDLPDLSSNAYATSSINQTVTITQPIDKIYIAHKSHSKYNQALGWIGSVYPDYLCVETNDVAIPDLVPDPPPLDFGTEGRFNIRELNTHKVIQQQEPHVYQKKVSRKSMKSMNSEAITPPPKKDKK